MFPCYNMATTMSGATLEEDIILAAGAGFRHIELRKEKLLNYLQRGHSTEELKHLLEEKNIKPVCINALSDVGFNKGQARLTVQELCHMLCYVGRSVGCPDLEVIASFRAPTDDYETVAAETADALTALGKIAAEYHMRLALEYMGVPKCSVRTFAHALDIVNRVGRDNVGLLSDTWHHFAGGSKPEDILNARGDQIFVVHVGDAPDKAPLTLRRSECVFPGDGAAPIAEMLRALRQIGYDGAVSVEVFDEAVQAMRPEECIPLAYQKTAAALKAAGVG